MKKFLSATGCAIVALTTVAALPARAEDPTPPAAPDSRSSVEQMTAGWLAKAYALPADVAAQRVTVQAQLGKTADALRSELGDEKTGGSYIDQKTGKLIVTVLNKAAAQLVGDKAQTRIVDNSAADLKGLQKSAIGKLGSTMKSAYVDVRANDVVVTVAKKDMAAAKRDLKGVNGVRVVEAPSAPVLQDEIKGGQQIEFTGYVCSHGFNATKGGEQVFITAGHCGRNNAEFSRNGKTLGKTQAYSFPGDDMAYSSINSGWTSPGSVDKWDGQSVSITGASTAPVGTAVCKSGRTTQWTCGEIEALDVSVNYTNDGGNDRVNGMTQTNACTEGGDSGGSWVAGTVAQGVTSGGMPYEGGKCGEKVGQKNVSYFQPVEPILSKYGLTIKTGNDGPSDPTPTNTPTTTPTSTPTSTPTDTPTDPRDPRPTDTPTDPRDPRPTNTPDDPWGPTPTPTDTPTDPGRWDGWGGWPWW